MLPTVIKQVQSPLQLASVNRQQHKYYRYYYYLSVQIRRQDTKNNKDLHTACPTFCRLHACDKPQQQVHDCRSTEMMQNTIKKLFLRFDKL